MQPVASQKTVPIILQAVGIDLASFSWVMLFDAIPCSVILFLDHSDATSFYHPSTCCKESLPLTAYCSSNCEETLCPEVCAPPLAREETSAHMLSGIKLAAISCTTWCPIPISAGISLSQVDFL
jgi:hypothetical protein